MLQTIIKTIVFFDMFDHPLTDWEIWKFGQFEEVVDFFTVKNLLENDLPGILEHKGGFYFLAGRENLIPERNRRYYWADLKFKRAVRMSRIFKLIPWIKMIAIGNFIGSHNARQGSDIDLLIVSKAHRLWLTRFFCASITALLGLRPKAGNNKDKICLSFFASEDGLDFSGLLLECNPPNPQYQGGEMNPSPFDKACTELVECGDLGDLNSGNTIPLAPNVLGGQNTGDIYFLYWLANLTPIYDQGGVYEKLIIENRKILRKLPNWQPVAMNYQRNAGQPYPFWWAWIFDLKFGWLEKTIQDWQMKKFPAEIKNLLNKDSRVIADKKIIKLHVNDRRKEYQEKFLNYNF